MFNRVQSTQDEKARFIKGNELKLTQVELFSFLFLKRVRSNRAYKSVKASLKKKKKEKEKKEKKKKERNYTSTVIYEPFTAIYNFIKRFQ